MTEWREYKIKEIADVIGGGTPSTSVNEYWNGNIPWLTPKDLTGYTCNFISHGERFITKKGLENSSAKLLPKGAVLLTSRAPIGYVAIAENEICTNQGFKSLVPKQDKAYNLFLLYWIKANVEYLQSIGTGTTFQEISGSVLKEVDIAIPPLPEQKAIAEVLLSLDDKIDLLTRQNKTLEDLAQAYFRKWFIEDPSKEWKVGKLGDEFNIIMGQSPKGETYNDLKIGLPFFQGKAEFGFRFPLEKQYCSEPIKIADRFDTLLSVRAPVGALNMAMYRCCIGRGLAIPIHKKGYKHYTFYKMKSLQEVFDTYDDDGTVFGSISREKFLSIETVVPPDELVCYFDNFAKQFDIKIYENTLQIRTLTKLRGTLLPKLMSGQIRVKMGG